MSKLETAEAGSPMTLDRALSLYVQASPWLLEQIERRVECACGHCHLCAYRFLQSAAARVREAQEPLTMLEELGASAANFRLMWEFGLDEEGCPDRLMLEIDFDDDGKPHFAIWTDGDKGTTPIERAEAAALLAERAAPVPHGDSEGGEE